MNVEFVAAVDRMRALQKKFFRTRAENRPPDLIRLCKDAERQVDKAIEEFAKPGTFFSAMMED